MLTSRIEKIAKKLSVFTIDDISVILEEPENVIAKNLQELTGDNRLKFNNEKYFYIEPIREKPKKKKTI